MTGCTCDCSKSHYCLYPVGTVRKGPERTAVEIEDEYVDALLGLGQFSHIVVLYWFHQNDSAARRDTLRVHPRGNRDNPLTGVFATRSPRRPNLIAMSVCRIQSIEENTVLVDAIDALDGSPVLDIKPYLPRIDDVSDATYPAWVE